MRINKYVASASNLSRRAADTAIGQGKVKINGWQATTGDQVTDQDNVTLDGRALMPAAEIITIMLNKPTGYICSRDGQGGQTIYDLLPIKYLPLQLVGRLDKDSSGLILLTNDGKLAQQLTHPSYQKTKIYEIELDQPLQPLHQQMISDHGLQLEDGPSKLQLQKRNDRAISWQVTMHEGRNRQIRRTFEAVGYKVTKLHRTQFGPYILSDLAKSKIKPL